jgi:hypothetical protein
MSYSNEKWPRSEDVDALKNALAPLGVLVHHYETIPNVGCGCWDLRVRKDNLLFRFFWDERDRLLSFEETDYSPSAKQFIWHSTFAPKVDVDNSREPFRYIEEVLTKKFQIEN